MSVLAYFQKEKGSDTIKELPERAAQNQCNIYFCIINLGEAMYVTEREQGLQAAQMALSLIKELPIEVVMRYLFTYLHKNIKCYIIRLKTFYQII